MLHIDRERYILARESSSTALLELSGSEETTGTMRAIDRRYELGDRISDIARITAYALVGLVPIAKFRAAIQEAAALDAETARRVAQDICDEIFSQVVDDLRYLND